MILLFFVSLACCCGLCMPNMFTTKANAKETLGEIVLPLHYESKEIVLPLHYESKITKNYAKIAICIIECFRGRHRWGCNSTSFCSSPDPFLFSRTSLFHLKTLIPVKGTPEAPPDCSRFRADGNPPPCWNFYMERKCPKIQETQRGPEIHG